MNREHNTSRVQVFAMANVICRRSFALCQFLVVLFILNYGLIYNIYKFTRAIYVVPLVGSNNSRTIATTKNERGKNTI